MYRAVDIETGSLSRESDILQIGIVTADGNFNVLTRDNFYFWKDCYSITKEAMDVNHLTPEFLKENCKDFDKNVLDVVTLLHNAVLITKNGQNFDIPILFNWLQRYAPSYNVNLYGGLIETQNDCAPLFREIKGITDGKKKGTLEEWIEAFKLDRFLPPGKAHDAVYDAEATLYAYREAFLCNLVPEYKKEVYNL